MRSVEMPEMLERAVATDVFDSLDPLRTILEAEERLSSVGAASEGFRRGREGGSAILLAGNAGLCGACTDVLDGKAGLYIPFVPPGTPLGA